MPFQIDRFNQVKNETITAPAQYNTGEEAFRAAMQNVTTYITDHWDNAGVGNSDGPDDGGRFKIYIERRPGRAEVELRWDYPIVDDRETNSIFWLIKLIP